MTDPLLKLLSRKIRNCGMTRAELARQTGLSAPTIHNIEYCYHQPNSGTISKLLPAIGLKIVEDTGTSPAPA